MTEMEALVKALQAIADGQKQIIDELKTIKEAKPPPGDLIPVRMPDGSTQMVPKSSLQASTQGAAPGKMGVIQNPTEIRKDPWPDPAIPKPPLVR